MRRDIHASLGLAVLVTLSLIGCDPASVSQCLVRQTPRGAYLATVTLHNGARSPIVESEVLIDASKLGPRGGHRLFYSVAPIGPGQSRAIRGAETVPGRSDGKPQNDWSFKDWFDERRGCELEHVDFADGTNWEQPSPL